MSLLSDIQDSAEPMIMKYIWNFATNLAKSICLLPENLILSRTIWPLHTVECTALYVFFSQCTRMQSPLYLQVCRPKFRSSNAHDSSPHTCVPKNLFNLLWQAQIRGVCCNLIFAHCYPQKADIQKVNEI